MTLGDVPKILGPNPLQHRAIGLVGILIVVLLVVDVTFGVIDRRNRHDEITRRETANEKFRDDLIKMIKLAQCPDGPQ